MFQTLWLASWYPSKVSTQNGDFIQRHAQAASQFVKVYVLHVTGDDLLKSATETDIQQHGKLTEEIIYYKKRKTGITKGISSFYKYIFLYKKAVRKYIATQGKPDIVHVHVCMRAGLLALYIKKKYGIPYVLTEHWTAFSPQREDNFLTKNPLFKYFAKKIFANASAILPVSNNLGNNIRKMVINKPFIKIPNVVSDRFFYKENNETPEPFTFLHVSSLSELKNPKGILRAFKNVLQKQQNIVLKVIGKNIEGIEKYAAEINVPEDKLIFKGEISNDEVSIEMRSSNAFILFSNTENAPCVISESLCCGLPVISTNVGGIAELIKENCGILILAQDETALENAMLQMITSYERYNRKKISDDAIKEYGYAIVGQEIVQVYDRVINNRR